MKGVKNMKQWSKPEIKNLAISSTNEECLRTSNSSTYKLPQWSPNLNQEQIDKLIQLGWDALCCACNKFDLNEALSKYCDCLGNPNLTSAC